MHQKPPFKFLKHHAAAQLLTSYEAEGLSCQSLFHCRLRRPTEAHCNLREKALQFFTVVWITERQLFGWGLRFHQIFFFPKWRVRFFRPINTRLQQFWQALLEISTNKMSRLYSGLKNATTKSKRMYKWWHLTEMKWNVNLGVQRRRVI